MNFALELFLILPLFIILVNCGLYLGKNKLSAIQYEKIIARLAFSALSL